MQPPRPRPPSPPAARLRAAGLHPTPQRRAILAALERRLDHPTADLVFDGLGTTDATCEASRTTVYRTLEAFVQAGLAQRVGHLGAAARYDPRTDAHDHVVCEACGAVRDVESQDGPELPGQSLEVAGFTVHTVTRLLRGRCSACR